MTPLKVTRAHWLAWACLPIALTASASHGKTLGQRGCALQVTFPLLRPERNLLFLPSPPSPPSPPAQCSARRGTQCPCSHTPEAGRPGLRAASGSWASVLPPEVSSKTFTFKVTEGTWRVPSKLELRE